MRHGGCFANQVVAVAFLMQEFIEGVFSLPLKLRVTLSLRGNCRLYGGSSGLIYLLYRVLAVTPIIFVGKVLIVSVIWVITIHDSLPPFAIKSNKHKPVLCAAE
jgi:hypothetical protein